MRTHKEQTSAFQKVGPCLYRYLPNGVYYGLFKVDRKEIRCSLETTDCKPAERTLAKKKEQQSQIDRSKSRMTLVVQRIKSDWPTGSQTQAASRQQGWQGSCVKFWTVGLAYPMKNSGKCSTR